MHWGRVTPALNFRFRAWWSVRFAPWWYSLLEGELSQVLPCSHHGTIWVPHNLCWINLNNFLVKQGSTVTDREWDQCFVQGRPGSLWWSRRNPRPGPRLIPSLLEHASFPFNLLLGLATDIPATTYCWAAMLHKPLQLWPNIVKVLETM